LLLVEDHPIVRRGMRASLAGSAEFQICAEASTTAEALEALEREQPDVVCLDLALGAADAFPLIRQMIDRVPDVRILVVSVRDEESCAERCVQAGARGYVMKSEPVETLLTALHSVAQGKIHLSSRVAMTVLEAVPRGPTARTGVKSLSERELQIFHLIGLGWTTRRIGERLGIGLKTVETHRENIKNKLHIEHSTALVREATRWVQSNS
jgi:DNA-binding NarL/FixJ family response regulator